jgi:hypothetical protein
MQTMQKGCLGNLSHLYVFLQILLKIQPIYGLQILHLQYRDKLLIRQVDCRNSSILISSFQRCSLVLSIPCRQGTQDNITFVHQFVSYICYMTFRKITPTNVVAFARRGRSTLTSWYLSSPLLGAESRLRSHARRIYIKYYIGNGQSF